MTTTIPTADTPARFAATLRRLSVCRPARKWAAGKDYATAWATCPRADWLLWLLDTAVLLDTKTNELLVCRFAREVLHLNPDPRVLACIETREAWARGEATDAARDAAQAAAWAAAGDAAGAAAGAAAWAAAWAAAGAAARAAAGAAAWATAGDAATWAAARDAAGVRQCEIIRQICPMPILL